MIDAQYFTDNRQRLLERVGDAPIILSAHSEMQRVKDMAFKFEQESSFLWLTGIDASEWKLVIANGVSYLVKPDMDDVHAIFNGALSADDAKRISGVDEVLAMSEYNQLIARLTKEHSRVYTLGDDPSAQWYSFSLNPATIDLRKKLTKTFNEVIDCRSDIAALRAIKQPAELEALRSAINVSIVAFQALTKQLSHFQYEYELEAVLNSEFRITGAGGHAYEPIVAAGKNACTLHYDKNNDPLVQNGLVLIDAGARVNRFAADVTRTLAVGTPSNRQRTVHSAVETAHNKIISLIKPGVLLQNYQELVDEIMKDALQEVGLLKNREDQKAYRKYFPHAISHGLGIDVHESLGGYKEFKPGMVLTVEPGIYIPEEGIGVRIEDDILVTETGNENLSKELSTSL